VSEAAKTLTIMKHSAVIGRYVSMWKDEDNDVYDMIVGEVDINEVYDVEIIWIDEEVTNWRGISGKESDGVTLHGALTTITKFSNVRSGLHNYINSIKFIRSFTMISIIC